MNKKFYILLANSILLATGIMLVLISAVQFNNFWPFVIIIVNMFAIMWPTLCGGCTTDDEEFGYHGNSSVTQASVSWILLGIFITAGYAIPIELFRAKVLNVIATYMTLLGGTIMLIGILIYIRILHFEKDEGYAYTF